MISKVVSKVPDKQVMSDLDATVAWAKQSGKANTAKLGITGFCWGGRIVWLYAAHNPDLKAGVAWYGRLVGDKDELHPKQPLEVVKDFKAPVLGLYGGADQGIPVATVDQMRDALKAAGKPARDRRISRHAARLQCRLSPQLHQERGRRRLEADARLVQAQRRGLTASIASRLRKEVQWPPLPKLLALALQHHQSGKLVEAERIYRQILQAVPNEPDAWHRLGLLACQAGNATYGIDAIRRAIAINPLDAAYHNNLGLAYQSLGRTEEVLASHRQAVKVNRNWPDGHFSLGVALARANRLPKRWLR